MFKIKYRITDTTKELKNLSKQEIEEGGPIEGYFQLITNNKTHGYINEGLLKTGEEGWELITNWLEQLLTMLILLKEGHNYVVIDEIESYNTWIEFKQSKKEKISISIIHAEKKEGKGYIQTMPPENIVPSDWANEEVSYDQMHHEIINKATQYIAEVDKINPQLANGATFVRLKELLRKAKNIA